MMVAPPAAGGGSPGTLPVSGALLWLAPNFGQYTDAGTTPVSSDGDHIYQWNDQSGNGYHAVQTVDGPSSPPWRPRYSTTVTDARGKRSVTFDKGVGMTFNLPDALGTALVAAGAGEMFVVIKNRTANTTGQRGGWHLGGTGGGGALNDTQFLWENGEIFEWFGTNSSSRTPFPGQDLSDAFSVYDVFSATNDYGMLLDNASIYTSGTNTVTFPTSGLKFGVNGNNYFLDSNVSEVVIFPFKLSSGDRSLMYTHCTT